jgi:hypothetical protein
MAYVSDLVCTIQMLTPILDIPYNFSKHIRRTFVRLMRHFGWSGEVRCVYRELCEIGLEIFGNFKKRTC